MNERVLGYFMIDHFHYSWPYNGSKVPAYSYPILNGYEYTDSMYQKLPR